MCGMTLHLALRPARSSTRVLHRLVCGFLAMLLLAVIIWLASVPSPASAATPHASRLHQDVVVIGDSPHDESPHDDSLHNDLPADSPLCEPAGGIRRTPPGSVSPASFVETEYPVVGDIAPSYDSAALVEYLRTVKDTYEVPALSFAWRSLADPAPTTVAMGYPSIPATTSSSPLTPENRFRIASLTKPLTAGILYDEMDAGRLLPETRVFCPPGTPALSANSTRHPTTTEPGCMIPVPVAPVDTRMYDVTLYNLLTHTTGWEFDLNHDPVFAWWNVSNARTDGDRLTSRQLLEYVLVTPLSTAPSTFADYQNSPYVIAALAIQAYTGDSFADVLSSHYPGVVSTGVLRDHRDPREPDYFCSRRLTSFFDPSKDVCASDGAFSLQYGAGAIDAAASPTALVAAFSDRCPDGSHTATAHSAHGTYREPCETTFAGYMHGTFAAIARTPTGVWAMTWNRSPYHDGPFDDPNTYDVPLPLNMMLDDISVRTSYLTPVSAPAPLQVPKLLCVPTRHDNPSNTLPFTPH